MIRVTKLFNDIQYSTVIFRSRERPNEMMMIDGKFFHMTHSPVVITTCEYSPLLSCESLDAPTGKLYPCSSAMQVCMLARGGRRKDK